MGVQQISRFWHRRLCEASMLYAVIIVALWAWRHFGGVDQYNLVLGIPLIAVILAGITGLWQRCFTSGHRSSGLGRQVWRCISAPWPQLVRLLLALVD